MDNIVKTPRRAAYVEYADSLRRVALHRGGGLQHHEKAARAYVALTSAYAVADAAYAAYVAAGDEVVAADARRRELDVVADAAYAAWAAAADEVIARKG